MAETPRQRFINRHGALKRVRSPWDALYQQIADYLLPWRLRMNPKDARLPSFDKILDPAGTLALRTCNAGMAAGFCSPARVWFRYGPPAALLAFDRRIAEKPEVKGYLAEVEDVSRDILLRSNFYGVTSGSAFYDLPAFGTFGMLGEEDHRNVVRFRPMTVGQYWLAANAAGDIDTIHELMAMTVGGMMERYGDRCSEQVKDQYRRGQYDVTHLVLRIIEPNRRDEQTGFEGQRSRWGWEGMDFRSVWMELGNAENRDTGFLKVGGFRTFPGITPRWGRTSSDDVYGTGPAAEALPDVKQLQTLVRRKLQMIDKQSLPTLRGPADLTNGIPSQLPGGFVPVPGGTGNDKLEPIYVPDHGAVNQVREEIRELKYSIKEGLFADLWRLITDDDRAQPGTAEEIRAKREERLLQLGPVGNNIEQEYLRRVLDRTYELADAAGYLPEPPPELAGFDLKVEFLSVMHEAQRAQEIPAVERVAAFVKALAQLDEEVIDTVDADKFAAKYAEVANLPPELMRSPEAVKALREARAEKREAAETGAALGAAAQGAKDLSQANLENDNALARIIGGLGPVVGAQAGVSPPGLTGGLA